MQFIFILVSGSDCNDQRYKYNLRFGYGVPLIITIITGIVEVTAPECSWFKPRFGEEVCFFTTLEAKVRKISENFV